MNGDRTNLKITVAAATQLRAISEDGGRSMRPHARGPDGLVEIAVDGEVLDSLMDLSEDPSVAIDILYRRHLAKPKRLERGIDYDRNTGVVWSWQPPKPGSTP